MYKSNGMRICETIEDVIKRGITHIWEYEENYYVLVKPDDFYENSIWVINKKNKKLSWMFYTSFFAIEDKAKEVEPQELKKLLKAS